MKETILSSHHAPFPDTMLACPYIRNYATTISNNPVLLVSQV